jgi:hypothetical protein
MGSRPSIVAFRKRQTGGDPNYDSRSLGACLFLAFPSARNDATFTRCSKRSTLHLSAENQRTRRSRRLQGCQTGPIHCGRPWPSLPGAFAPTFFSTNAQSAGECRARIRWSREKHVMALSGAHISRPPSKRDLTGRHPVPLFATDVFGCQRQLERALCVGAKRAAARCDGPLIHDVCRSPPKISGA